MPIPIETPNEAQSVFLSERPHFIKTVPCYHASVGNAIILETDDDIPESLLASWKEAQRGELEDFDIGLED